MAIYVLFKTVYIKSRRSFGLASELEWELLIFEMHATKGLQFLLATPVPMALTQTTDYTQYVQILLVSLPVLFNLWLIQQ